MYLAQCQEALCASSPKLSLNKYLKRQVTKTEAQSESITGPVGVALGLTPSAQS